jgi:DNA-binding transcriptional LysR family regulator
MVAVRAPNRPDMVARRLGYLHMLPVACQPYIERYGVPTRSNLSSHCFVQTEICSKRGGMWDSWLDLIEQGVVTHSCDNLLTYSLMVKYGLGIGLVGSCAMADPKVVPLELGVHIRAPIYAVAPSERLTTRAVQIVFDWLSDIFGETVPWFGAELKLDSLPRDSLTETVNTLLGGLKRSP